MNRSRAAAFAALLLIVAAPARSADPAGPAPPAAPAAEAPAATVPPAAPAPAAEVPLVAVLPIENLSGAEVPLDRLQAGLRGAFEERGLRLLPEEPLREFMRRERMRYVGGLSGEMARALREATGARAAIVTSLDLYQAADPPKVALTARLVTTDDAPRILWMDGAAATGDDKPGVLGLGLIHAPEPIEADVLGRIAASLAASWPAPAGPPGSIDAHEAIADVPRRFRPKSLYRAGDPRPPEGRPARVAVLPFANDSAAKNAGDLLTLQMVRQVRLAPGVEVIEPGVVREALLRAHLVQDQGISLPQADLVRLRLDADLVIFGNVDIYVEAWAGSPEAEVDFAARALSTRTRQIACASISRGRGDDGVFFFGLGRIPTAHELSAGLSRGFVAGCLAASRGA